MQSRQHGPAEARSLCLSQARASAGLSQLSFEQVKMLEVPQEPAGDFRRAFAGFMELAPDMGQAAGEGNVLSAPPGKAIVGLVAIALDGAAKVQGDNLLQAGRGPARLPMEDRVAARNAARPKVTQLSLAVARCEIADRCFIHLHIAMSKHFVSYLVVDRLQPLGS